MKRKLSLMLGLICFFCSSIHARQQDTIQVKSIEAAINQTLVKFRQRISNKEAVTYCMIKNRLDMGVVNFDGKNLLVEQGINARYIDKKVKKYLLTFLVYGDKKGLTIDVSVSSIEKKTNKRLEYLVHSFDIPTVYRVVFD